MARHWGIYSRRESLKFKLRLKFNQSFLTAVFLGLKEREVLKRKDRNLITGVVENQRQTDGQYPRSVSPALTVQLSQKV